MTRHEPVIIIGAGGHARVIADIVDLSGHHVLGFLDDHLTGNYSGSPVLGKVSDFARFRDSVRFVIGVGDNEGRRHLADLLGAACRFYAAVHPAATIARSATIGDGAVVMAHAVINPDTHIGPHAIINTSASVDHDCRIAAFAHISPGATLAGTVAIGEETWIGAGAVIINNINICDKCVIGAGSLVLADIKRPGMYYGSPARWQRER